METIPPAESNPAETWRCDIASRSASGMSSVSCNPQQEMVMSIFDDISRFGAALRNARRHRMAIREMNSMPPELQKDIGWAGSEEARAASNARNMYWRTLV
jgi:hypothetical protein